MAENDYYIDFEGARHKKVATGDERPFSISGGWVPAVHYGPPGAGKVSYAPKGHSQYMEKPPIQWIQEKDSYYDSDRKIGLSPNIKSAGQPRPFYYEEGYSPLSRGAVATFLRS